MNKKITQDRMFVSKLILQVLAEKISVQKAISNFPATNDPSLQASWHAIMHYEADEDVRKYDMDFSQTQDETLEVIAFTLQAGKPLPQNIINEYNKYHDKAVLPKKTGIKSFFERLIRFTI